MSNLLPSSEILQCSDRPQLTTQLDPYPARAADLGGGFTVRRALPRRQRRMVGAWCFLDHFGPLNFASGKPLDVAPHPHIGLQTVTWLISGEVLHRDSLGNEQLIVPGQLNLMTAGRGLSHSEETPIRHSGSLHGVQLWTALPENARKIEPGFEHHTELPEFRQGQVRVVVLIGSLAAARSNARAYSDIVGAEITCVQNATLDLPLDVRFEYALFPIEGIGTVADSALEPNVLYYLGTGRNSLTMQLTAGARFLLLGGVSFGEEILMWWNFVARTAEEITEARNEWEHGSAFGQVQGYPGKRTPAPPLKVRPKI